MGFMGRAAGCALLLVRGEDLSFVWCNEEYRELLDELSTATPLAGRPLSEIAPLSHATRSSKLHEVLATGVAQQGEDRLFSVEDGSTLHQWAAYRPIPDHVLVAVHVVPAPLPQEATRR